MKNQKKRQKKKLYQLKIYINQVLRTAEKINFAEHLLKDLKPYLSTSVNRFTKFKLQELSDIIEEVLLNQIDLYVNTEKKVENMIKNATFAYTKTLNNSYLDTIRDLKNVIPNARQTYTTIYGRK